MRIFIIIYCIVVSFASALAQTYPDPEFTEKPMYYDQGTQTLLPLERQISPYKQTTSMYSQYIYYRLAASPVRLKRDEKQLFLIRLFNPVELDLFIFLYPLTANKDDRMIKLKGARLQTPDDVISYQYKKVGDGLYLLSIDNLPPGEYVWYLKSASYLFAVD